MVGIAERVTWSECPQCGGRTAIGWLRATITELDCVNGCELEAELSLAEDVQAEVPATSNPDVVRLGEDGAHKAGAKSSLRTVRGARDSARTELTPPG